MNTINNNISFGARLDCKHVNGNQARWAKIAEVFEAKTKQYPDDVFVLETNDKGGIYFYPTYSNTKLEKAAGSYDKGEIDLDSTNALEMCSSKKAADILKRLFNIRRKSDNMLLDYFNFEHKYGLTDDSKGNMVDEFFTKFGHLRKAYTKHLLENDKILGTWTGIDVI